MVAVNPLVPSLKPSRAPQLNKKKDVTGVVLHFCSLRFVLVVKSMKYNGKNAKTYHKLRQRYIVMLPNLPFAFSSAKTNADIFKLTCFGVQTECHSKACELPYEGKTESGC